MKNVEIIKALLSGDHCHCGRTLVRRYQMTLGGFVIIFMLDGAYYIYPPSDWDEIHTAKTRINGFLKEVGYPVKVDFLDADSSWHSVNTKTGYRVENISGSTPIAKLLEPIRVRIPLNPIFSEPLPLP